MLADVFMVQHKVGPGRFWSWPFWSCWRVSLSDEIGTVNRSERDCDGQEVQWLDRFEY